MPADPQEALATAEVESWTPDWTVIPGEHVRESREAVGMTQAALARAWGVTQPYVNGIERGHRSITARVALRLEGMGWGPAVFWMNLQVSHDLFNERQRLASLPSHSEQENG